MKFLGVLLFVLVGCGGNRPDGPGILLGDELADDVAEPTVDVDGVAVVGGQSENPDEMLLGVGVRTVGGPAPDTAFSNYVELRITIGNIIRQATVQRHDGVNETLVVGFDESELVYQKRPWGHFFVIPIPTTDGATLDIEAGFLLDMNGEFLQDMLDGGPQPLPVLELIPPDGILDEIEAVLVPA